MVRTRALCVYSALFALLVVTSAAAVDESAPVRDVEADSAPSTQRAVLQEPEQIDADPGRAAVGADGVAVEPEGTPNVEDIGAESVPSEGGNDEAGEGQPEVHGQLHRVRRVHPRGRTKRQRWRPCQASRLAGIRLHHSEGRWREVRRSARWTTDKIDVRAMIKVIERSTAVRVPRSPTAPASAHSGATAFAAPLPRTGRGRGAVGAVVAHRPCPCLPQCSCRRAAVRPGKRL